MPTPAAFDTVLGFARERGARASHTEGICPAYLAPVMVLAYGAGLRGIGVCTLTDAHRLQEGVYW